MKHRTVNDYFKQQWPRLILFAAFTLGVSFFAPLKNIQLKWLIDSKSKQEALGYMGLVFAITFSSWFFERLSRRSFTKLACGAVEQVRGQVMERVLRRPVAQYQQEGDAAYISLLTTALRTLYDDYYMSLFNIAFWGGIMLCALGMYLYISPVMLAAILLVTVPPLVLPRKMNERLKAARDAFSLQMAGYTQQLKELLGGFEVIRGFLREDAYAARHRDAARQARTSALGYQQSLTAMVVNTSLIRIAPAAESGTETADDGVRDGLEEPRVAQRANDGEQREQAGERVEVEVAQVGRVGRHEQHRDERRCRRDGSGGVLPDDACQAAQCHADAPLLASLPEYDLRRGGDRGVLAAAGDRRSADRRRIRAVRSAVSRRADQL